MLRICQLYRAPGGIAVELSSMPPSVFLSHVTAESNVALAVREQLELAIPGLRVFASSADIALGSRWLAEIDIALRRAKALLVLCSRWSVERRWINFEAGAGWGQKKPVIPLCPQGMRTADLPDLLQALQAQNLHDEGDCRTLVSKLAAAVQLVPAAGFDYAAMARAIRPVPPHRGAGNRRRSESRASRLAEPSRYGTRRSGAEPVLVRRPQPVDSVP